MDGIILRRKIFRAERYLAGSSIARLAPSSVFEMLPLRQHLISRSFNKDTQKDLEFHRITRIKIIIVDSSIRIERWSNGHVRLE